MSFEIEGKLIEKFDTVVVSDKFQKREFVIETSDDSSGTNYTEEIKFQLMQSKCDVIDSLQTGNTIKVHFNIKGRRWEKDGKTSFFTNLDAWRVESVGAIATPPQSQPTQIEQSSEPIGDLPF